MEHVAQFTPAALSTACMVPVSTARRTLDACPLRTPGCRISPRARASSRRGPVTHEMHRDETSRAVLLNHREPAIVNAKITLLRQDCDTWAAVSDTSPDSSESMVSFMVSFMYHAICDPNLCAIPSDECDCYCQADIVCQVTVEGDWVIRDICACWFGESCETNAHIWKFICFSWFIRSRMHLTRYGLACFNTRQASRRDLGPQQSSCVVGAFASASSCVA